MSRTADASSSHQSEPPAAAGVTIDCQIRWGDLDALGHVNNVIYFQFCESARIAYFETIGFDQFKDAPTDGPGMVSANLNFRRQLHYPGDVRVHANAIAVGEKSFTLRYVLRDLADQAIVADGDSVCVWVDYAAAKAKRLPDAMVARISEIEQSPQLLRKAP